MRDLILLHGAIGASDQLFPLKKQLSEKFKVTTFDFAGHGERSNEDFDFSIPNFAKDLDDFLETNSIKSPYIFGYSMGGYVAIYHSLHFRNKAERIITLGTKFCWSPEISAQEIKMLDAETMEEKIPQFAAQLKTRHGEMNWKKVLEKTKTMMTEMGANNPFVAADVKKLSNPALFGLGDADRMVSLEETKDFCNSSSKGSLFILANTPHPIEKVNMDLLVFEINKFLL